METQVAIVGKSATSSASLGKRATERGRQASRGRWAVSMTTLALCEPRSTTCSEVALERALGGAGESW